MSETPSQQFITIQLQRIIIKKIRQELVNTKEKHEKMLQEALLKEKDNYEKLLHEALAKEKKNHEELLRETLAKERKNHEELRRVAFTEAKEYHQRLLESVDHQFIGYNIFVLCMMFVMVNFALYVSQCE
jgi:Fe2+ transport system protein B